MIADCLKVQPELPLPVAKKLLLPYSHFLAFGFGGTPAEQDSDYDSSDENLYLAELAA